MSKGSGRGAQALVIQRIPIALVLALLAAGCAPRPSGVTSQTVTVFAAASLAEACEAAGQAFTDANAGVTIEFNFAASDQLAQQILAGAPADVFASANMTQMQNVIDGGAIGAQAVSVFVHNRLVIITPTDNPAAVASLEDLARPGLRLVLAAAEAPAGRYALEVLRNASTESGLGVGFEAAVVTNIVSYEENVRAVLAKVSLGEADAGMVYATDAQSAGDDVIAIEIPEVWNVVADYPIAPVSAGAHPEQAQAFIAFLLSPDGQGLLAEFGFEPAVR